jgi:hypothetical protein
MRTLFQLAAGLCYINAVLHFMQVFMRPSETRLSYSLVWGIIFLVLGIILTFKKRFAIWLGFIIPIVPLVLSPYLTDFADKWNYVVLALDFAIALCCLLMIANKRKA